MKTSTVRLIPRLSLMALLMFPLSGKGGPFVPVDSVMIIESGTSTVCGQTVTKKRVNFYPPSIPGPTDGETHFQGRLFNVTTGQFIPKTHYVLQWWINIQNQGCANNVSGSTTDVRFAAQQGVSYVITAHFKPGYVPTGTPTIELQGDWIVL